ncbi:hypothetical protein DNX69_07525 [Rhodopseudomonas palustris]|uniref:Uncharacterized protein n=1 Tax=Rhodopseudomonas palustris TaxID=1076 RepID=A0A323UKP7_RHOPL|nr:hypothetical protein DNX69_07525 [Rhodopseudomonas palustris]
MGSCDESFIVIARSTRIGATRRPGTGSAAKQSSSVARSWIASPSARNDVDARRRTTDPAARARRRGRSGRSDSSRSDGSCRRRAWRSGC